MPGDRLPPFFEDFLLEEADAFLEPCFRLPEVFLVFRAAMNTPFHAEIHMKQRSPGYEEALPAVDNALAPPPKRL